MNKVVTVTLAGRAWQLEEPAYDALRAYLDTATTRLHSNPDRDEILVDFETAIGDRCGEFITPGKDVIAGGEMESILAHMGAVEGDDADAVAIEPEAEERAPRRLLRLREGAMLGGVSSGLAAYFNIDVAIVRVAWVIITILSGGGGILAYAIAWIVVPEASTVEERAAAGGNFPVAARDLMDRAARTGKPALHGAGEGIRKLARLALLVIGLFATFLALTFLATWVAALWSTVADGTVFGLTFDPGTEVWVLRAWITSLVWVLAAPVLFVAVLARRLWHRDRGWHFNPVFGIAGTALWVAAVVSTFMIAWTSTPDIRRTLDDNDARSVTLGRYTICIEDGRWTNTRDHAQCPERTEHTRDLFDPNRDDLVQPAEPDDPAEPAEPAEPVEPAAPID